MHGIGAGPNQYAARNILQKTDIFCEPPAFAWRGNIQPSDTSFRLVGLVLFLMLVCGGSPLPASVMSVDWTGGRIPGIAGVRITTISFCCAIYRETLFCWRDSPSSGIASRRETFSGIGCELSLRHF